MGGSASKERDQVRFLKRGRSVDCLLGVLLAVDAVRTIELDGLYNAAVVTEALRRYETIWLPLLAQHTAEGRAARLVPPLDVLRDCLQLLGRVIHYSPSGEPTRPPAMPCLLLGLSQTGSPSLDRSAQAKRLHVQRIASEAAWQEWVKLHTPGSTLGGEPYEPLYFNHRLMRCAATDGFVSRLSVDIVASARRQRAFVTNVFNCHILGSLKKAVLRYAFFLHLHSLHPHTMLVPTYDIDLVWHTHMMHTQHYEDCVGDGFDHDDSLEHAHAEKSMVRDGAFELTCSLWWAAFCNERGPLVSNPAVRFKGVRTDSARALPEALYWSAPPHHLEYLAPNTTNLRISVPGWSSVLFADAIWTTGLTEGEVIRFNKALKPCANTRGVGSGWSSGAVFYYVDWQSSECDGSGDGGGGDDGGGGCGGGGD